MPSLSFLARKNSSTLIESQAFVTKERKVTRVSGLWQMIYLTHSATLFGAMPVAAVVSLETDILSLFKKQLVISIKFSVCLLTKRIINKECY